MATLILFDFLKLKFKFSCIFRISKLKLVDNPIHTLVLPLYLTKKNYQTAVISAWLSKIKVKVKVIENLTIIISEVEVTIT